MLEPGVVEEAVRVDGRVVADDAPGLAGEELVAGHRVGGHRSPVPGLVPVPGRIAAAQGAHVGGERHRDVLRAGGATEDLLELLPIARHGGQARRHRRRVGRHLDAPGREDLGLQGRRASVPVPRAEVRHVVEGGRVAGVRRAVGAGREGKPVRPALLAHMAGLAREVARAREAAVEEQLLAERDLLRRARIGRRARHVGDPRDRRPGLGRRPGRATRQHGAQRPGATPPSAGSASRRPPPPTAPAGVSRTAPLPSSAIRARFIPRVAGVGRGRRGPPLSRGR